MFFYIVKPHFSKLLSTMNTYIIRNEFINLKTLNVFRDHLKVENNNHDTQMISFTTTLEKLNKFYEESQEWDPDDYE